MVDFLYRVKNYCIQIQNFTDSFQNKTKDIWTAELPIKAQARCRLLFNVHAKLIKSAQ